MPFAAAHSVHPSAADAIGEITGQVVDRLGDDPDLALLFVTGHHAGTIGECGDVVRTLLRPTTLAGGTFSTVLANGQQAGHSAMTLWAGRFGEVHPLRLGSGAVEADPGFEPTALVLFIDPWGSDVDGLLNDVADHWPGLPVVGALVSGDRSHGDTRLLLDGRGFVRGAVGVLVGPGIDVDPVLAQGSRAVGRAHLVTAGGDGTIRALDGDRAATRLHQLSEDGLSEDERAVLDARGISVGITVGDGPELVRPVTHIDRLGGTVFVEHRVEVGATVRFHLRTAEAADDDLRATLNGRSADTALVFPSASREATLASMPGLDASVVDEYLGRVPSAGAAGAGVVGPVGGRNLVHTAGVSMALLRERDRPVGSGG